MEDFDDIILEITEITEEYLDTYVYDLETEDGTFGAGFGDIIVHNTDSVFISYKNSKDHATIDLQDKEQIQKVLVNNFEIGEEMAKNANSLFIKPISLEFEKIYLPHIMLGKKTYVSTMYETTNPDEKKIDKKGVVLKRRDNPNITKKIYQGIVDIIFKDGEKGINKCLDFLYNELNKISNQEISFDDLIVSKTYKGTYKSENIAHKILAEKMQKRDFGSAPRLNDRVPFVFIENKDDRAKQYEKVEHPDFVKENGLKLDSAYYIKQVRNPVSSLLSTFVDKKRIDKIFNESINDCDLKRKKQSKITSFIKK